jgi:hypothetical protein
MTLREAIHLLPALQSQSRVYMTEKDQDFIAIYYKGCYFSITKGHITAEPTLQCDECGMLLCPTDRHIHVYDIDEVEVVVRSWLEDVDRAWLVTHKSKYGTNLIELWDDCCNS